MHCLFDFYKRPAQKMFTACISNYECLRNPWSEGHALTGVNKFLSEIFT